MKNLMKFLPLLMLMLMAVFSSGVSVDAASPEKSSACLCANCDCGPTCDCAHTDSAIFKDVALRRGARRSGCSDGSCSVSHTVVADQPRAPKGGAVVDGKPYKGGQFVPREKEDPAAESCDTSGQRHGAGPVRRVGKGLKAVGRRILRPFGGCRRGC